MSKKIWFISDCHYNHANIIRYCNRPFNNTNEMDEFITERYNSVVSDSDIVFNLGDFCLFSGRTFRSPSEKVDFVRSYITRLKGEKYLILGNHDSIHLHSQIPEWKKIYDYPIIWKDGIILSHRPIEERLARPNFLRQNNLFNIFGHIHNNENAGVPFLTENSFCCSVEVIDYTPVSLEHILDTWNRIRSEKDAKETEEGK